MDQRRFRVLDVDAKGNLYLYNTALLCKNEIIKRLRNGMYSLAEQTELGMNTSVLFTSCPCILSFRPFNAILSGLGISKCVCTYVTYIPRKMFVSEMKPLS